MKELINANPVELLAPVGTQMALRAAVAGGADAVYLGAELFNARRNAENFTLDDLGKACDYAHLRNVRVYLTLNTIVLDKEIDEALELARQAYRQGIDAFIVQDIGLASEIKRQMPDAFIHASTQMNIHNTEGLEAAASLGFSRVVLARELSVSQINHLCTIAHNLNIEVEVFIHGALCISYSGQCLFSSLIGGRSANRGLCAQACRLPYTLHNKALRKTLPAEGEHLLSPKDLCGIDLIPQLVEAGVDSFKIEGRMKSAEYVFTTVNVYRRTIDTLFLKLSTSDLATQGQGTLGRNISDFDQESIDTVDRKLLKEVFSRGFTTAYLEGQRGNEIMSYQRPNNRGVFVGRVTEVSKGVVTITPEEELREGDLLEFWTNKGHFTHQLDEITRDRRGNVRLVVEKRVGKGDRVFRVRNASLAFESDPHTPRVPINGAIVLNVGSPLQITFSHVDKRGTQYSVGIEGAPLEVARTKAVTTEEVRTHINRLGNMPFELHDFKIDLGENVGIGFSQLHKIRSQALEQLEAEILKPYRGRALHKVSVRAMPLAVQKRGCMVAAWAANPACARAAKRAGAELIYVPAHNYKRGQAVIAGQLSETAEGVGYPKQSIIAMPAVSHDYIEGSREFEQGFDAWSYVKEGKPLLVEALGQLFRGTTEGSFCEIGSHIPLVNKLSLGVAAEKGARRVWLSPELSLSQIEDLGKETPIPLGITIIGRQELMITEHCLLMSQGSCDEQCLTCQRRKSPHYIKDRKDYETPIITDLCGRSHLYNAVLYDVAHVAPELIRAGITALMVDTTCMNVEETKKAVQRAVRARDIALKSGDAVSKAQEATAGHLFRGVQ